MTNILSKIVRICNSQFKCNYFKNKKHFLNFLFNFWHLIQILNILKEKMKVTANVFPKIQTVKNLVGALSKTRRFRTCFDSEHVKASQMLAKSPWEHFCHVFSSFLGKLIYKMSPLVLGEILGVFVNTFNGDPSIPLKIVRICYYQFKWILWKTKSFFLSFCSISGIYIKC